LQAVLRLVSVQ